MRKLALILAALLLISAAWVWRGYSPSARIAGKQITPLAFSPSNDVLLARTEANGPRILWNPDAVAASNAALAAAGIATVDCIVFLNPRDGSELLPPLRTAANPLYPRPVLRADCSPDGQKLAVLQDYEFAVFDLKSRDCITRQTMQYGQFSGALSVAFQFAPDSSFVVWCAQNYWVSPVVVFDLEARKERFSIPKNRFPAVSPDSHLLATIADVPRGDYSAKLVLNLWNSGSGELERAIPLGGNGYQLSPSFSPDGRLVAVTSAYGGGSTTEVFETATGKRVFEHKGWDPRLLADGKTLSMVWGQDVQLWDTTTWQLKRAHNFNLGRSWDNGDAINPRPQATPGQARLAVFNYYPSRHRSVLHWLGRVCQLNVFGLNQMTLIDASNDTRIAVELHEANFLNGCVFSPDGSRAALGYSNGTVEFWDIPPTRSYVALVCAALLLVVPALLLFARLRRKKAGPA